MSFICPRCGAESHHPKDAEHGYCGKCKQFVEEMIVATARSIYDIGKKARDRGILTIWTIYDKPLDHPDGIIARAFEVGGGKREPVPTGYTVQSSDINLIRKSMERCGLYCLPRQPNDHPSVVESWT